MLRRVHVVLTALLGVPVLVWTLTGFAFTCFDFDEVHAVGDRAPAPEIAEGTIATTDAIARARAAAGAGARVVQVRTRMLVQRPVHVVEMEGRDPIVIDARDGSVVRLDDRAASEIAVASYRGHASPLAVEIVTDDPDVRSPVWRVRLDDARHTDVFVSRSTGEVVSWRNDAWRRFDALWSIHVLGFVRRDHPAHWPLRILALLMLVATASGAAAWTGLLARRARRAATTAASRL